jgi:hypothetical protein
MAGANELCYTIRYAVKTESSKHLTFAVYLIIWFDHLSMQKKNWLPYYFS